MGRNRPPIRAYKRTLTSSYNFKVSTRYSVTENFGLRGTISTGFRAPTPGQSNSVRTSTTVTNEGVFESGTLSPTDPLAIALAAAIPGAPQPQPLGPEESTGITLGGVFTTGRFDLAIDFFRIDIDDRVTLSTDVPVDEILDAGGEDAERLQEAIDALIAAGDASAGSISGFNFFVNAFDTRTQGVDIVVSTPLDLGTGTSWLSFAYNHTDTKVTDSAFLSDARIFSIEKGLPEDRFNLTATHQQGGWRFLARGNYCGKVGVANDIGLGVIGEFDGYYGEKFLLDLETQYDFTEHFSVVFGVKNLFNAVPDSVPQPEAQNGHIYPEESPFGLGGGFYYLRVNYGL